MNINNILVAIVLISRFSKTNPIYIEYNTISNCQIKNPLINGKVEEYASGIQVVGNIIKDNIPFGFIKHSIHHNICLNVKVTDVRRGFSVNCGLYPLVLKNCGLYLSIESDPFSTIYGYEEVEETRENNIVPLINKIEGCHFDQIRVADPRYFSSDDNKNLNLGSDYNLAVPTYVARRDDNEEEDVTALLSVIENKAEREKDYNPATSIPRCLVTDLLKLIRKDKDPTKNLKSFDLYLDLKRDSYNYALADRFVIEGGEVVLKDGTLNAEEGLLSTRGILFTYTTQTDTGTSTTRYLLRVGFDDYTNNYRLFLNNECLASIDDIPSMYQIMEEFSYIQATKEMFGFVMIGDNIDVTTKKILINKKERDVSVISVKLGDKNNYGLLKVGKNIEVNNNTISIPEATNSTLGLVKGGGNINILNGILNVSKATPESLGAIKIGTGIKIAEDGTISADEVKVATTSVLGGIKAGDYIIVSNTGDVTLPIMTTAEITDLFNSAWYGIAN